VAYRPGRNAQQAVVEVGALLSHGHPEVVDADLADYFGSIPHAELLKSVWDNGQMAKVHHGDMKEIQRKPTRLHTVYRRP
jgi:retron-type reverse transcriptase